MNGIENRGSVQKIRQQIFWYLQFIYETSKFLYKIIQAQLRLEKIEFFLKSFTWESAAWNHERYNQLVKFCLLIVHGLMKKKKTSHAFFYTKCPNLTVVWISTEQIWKRFLKKMFILNKENYFLFLLFCNFWSNRKKARVNKGSFLFCRLGNVFIHWKSKSHPTEPILKEYNCNLCAFTHVEPKLRDISKNVF